MIVVSDTSVWSRFLRRRNPDPDDPWVRALRAQLEGDGVALVGVILQELLTGVRSPRVFDYVRGVLEPVPLLTLDRADHIRAAQIANACARKGVQVSGADCLIAAACVEYGYPLLTADQDFARIARHCDLRLLPPLP